MFFLVLMTRKQKMSIPPALLEAVIVASPITALTLAAGSDMMSALRSGGEAALAHALAVYLIGMETSAGYTAFGSEVGVAATTGGLLGAWVYFSLGDSPAKMNLALKSALLAGAMSYVGAKFVLPWASKYTQSK